MLKGGSIKREFTVPRTPQQNGVAERMNRTITERARSMRLHSGLPKSFWAEAVNTAVHLINRGPSSPLEERIPKEVWSGKKVDLSYLKVFGCTAFVHVDAAARSNLDAKAVRCTFVGYGGDEFGYKFWDNKNLKFIRSRDAVFKETEMFKEKDTAEDAEPVEQESFTEVDGSSEMDDRSSAYLH